MAKEKICGIYCIENLVNGKKYIGQSVDVASRFRGHKSELNRNLHKNGHLQNAWNQYKEENFDLSIIIKCEKDELDSLEKYYIDLFNSNTHKNGYNIEYGGNSKKIVPQSTKDKISKNHADVSGENNPFYGKKHSQESIDMYKNNENYISRKIRGEDSHTCKITYKIAKEIKEYFSNGHKTYRGEINEVALKYDISKQIVSHIKNGHAWVYI